jgi:hypothetical protein
MATYMVTFVNWIPEYAEVAVKASSLQEALAKAQDNWPSDFEPSDQSCKETIETIALDGGCVATIEYFPGVTSLSQVENLDEAIGPALKAHQEREEAQRIKWNKELKASERKAKQTRALKNSKSKASAKRISKGDK